MKKVSFLKFLSAVMFSLLGCVVFAEPIANVAHVSTYEAFVGLVKVDLAVNAGVAVVMYVSPSLNMTNIALSDLSKPKLAFAIQREIWADYIMKNLFKDSSFIKHAYNADRFVNQGKIVHIPQAGAKPTVTRNRSTLPAAVTSRVDTDVLYSLDEFTTDPTLIENADTIELSYDLMADVLSDHIESLQENIGDWMLYNWVANIQGGGVVARVIRTTGSTAATTAPGATGNRKVFTKDEVKAARTLFNKQNMPKENRKLLLPSDMLDQLMSDADMLKRDYAGELDLKNGTIVRLFGFDILERSDVITYDNTGTPIAKLPGAATATDDNLAALAWCPNAVERAVGEVKFFENLNDPTFFGDLYSALARVGGRKRRKDGKGILSIVQAASA